MSISVGDCQILSLKKARKFGVVFYECLPLDDHINAIIM